MKIDFSKVYVQATIEGEPLLVDFKKELGNLIYSRAADVALSDLGKDIYYKGVVDMPETLIHPLTELISASPLVYPVKKALFDLLIEKENGTKKTKTNK
ncbi:hypothetical protein [Massilibacteroides sp.]|uniref:hypothetical protein n=1 Tax=Massilibacteroides sp. TaxID=2034766 RepID=UPI002619C65B|nr:hypothetical protein [Massilibacteroides sp.]MDD4516464.1 hypothetical protein [Massilibacteroides sp.]